MLRNDQLGLRPTLDSHPDRTVMNAAMMILLRIRNVGSENYDGLLNYLRDTVREANSLFVPALDFLYLMGVIEFDPQKDVFTYVGPEVKERKRTKRKSRKS